MFYNAYFLHITGHALRLTCHTGGPANDFNGMTTFRPAVDQPLAALDHARTAPSTNAATGPEIRQ